MIENPAIEIPKLSVYDILKSTATEHPKNIAYEYLGHKETYYSFLKQVDDLSLRFRKMGIYEGDRVIICLPNCPQALVAFYALNRIGAISVMVHPLSSSNEIEYFIRDSGSKMAITLSKFLDNFPKIGTVEGFQTIIVTSPVDMMPKFKGKLAQLLYKDARMPSGSLGFGMVRWSKMMKDNIDFVVKDIPHVDDLAPASILYTGGTTGKNKGAVHSSRSFNVTSLGMIELSGVRGEGTKMLTEMPMFHGFGLCTCVHLPVCLGLTCILVPTFTLDSLCKTITKEKVSFMAGVPTLYEKIIDNKYLANADLSFMKGIFCGGDSMSIESKARVDQFLADHGCKTKVRIGYGCTECLTATAITPKTEERPGSVGVPIPGYKYAIFDPETGQELPDGEDGEICMMGESIMQEYYGHKEETEAVLKVHDDGRTWLHTGDLGCIKDGFIYFKNRIKRIIITSGYNVYPSQIEEILSHHPLVDSSCVIGVPDINRGSMVKAVVVLKKGVEKTPETLNSISAFVKSNISSYAKPRQYDFVDSLPKTKLGKIDYRKLEEEHSKEEENQSSSTKM
jgi:long-chain acyl-CoA synthetase